MGGHRGELRGEEGRGRPGPHHPREHRYGGGQEERQVRGARPGDDQDPQEARDEGGEEDDFRKGGLGQGEAGQDGREGLRGESYQGRVLKARSVRSLWSAARGPAMRAFVIRRRPGAAFRLVDGGFVVIHGLPVSEWFRAGAGMYTTFTT